MERKHTLVYGIKGKLISAVAMLLVAIIMVVSSTYAWFTLSTAPEVTGISTAIGANGALEIKLNTTVTDDVNGTYGNLVDLTDNNAYGLNKITLLPSQLIVVNNQIAANYLAFPEYGAEGRPKQDWIDDKAVIGKYTGNQFVPSSDDRSDSNGVSAVGVASGLTARQLAFRNAKNTAITNMSSAKNAARASLAANGSDLSTIVMKKATTDNPTFTQAELGYLENIVTDLQKNEGSLYYIEKAYIQQILAFAASAEADTLAGDSAKADAAFNYVSAHIGTEAEAEADSTNITITLRKIVTDKKITMNLTGEFAGEYVLNLEGEKFASILSSITAFIEIVDDVKAAKNGIVEIKKLDEYNTKTDDDNDTSNDGAITWSNLSEKVLNKILDYDKMTLNGYKASEVKDNMSALINSVAGKGINVEMKSDETGSAGVYVDIADHCGNYDAQIKIKKLTYGGLTLEDTEAKMITVSGEATPLLQKANLAVVAAGEPTSATTEVMPMTEFYGYIIDLIFKTNASDSKLLLQTAEKDRIYSDNNNELTQGGGSSMTFKSTTASFTDEKVAELMSAIRIVFFNTDDNTILAYAKLDTDNVTTDADGGVKAYMYLYITAYEYTYEVDNTETVDDTDDKTTITVYGKTATGATEFFTDAKCTTAAIIPEGTVPTATDRAEETLIDTQADATIRNLPLNAEVKVSTLVYLDGKYVDNSTVAATGTQSVTGSMNLQFSSSANLTPMEYGDLHIKGEATETTAP